MTQSTPYAADFADPDGRVWLNTAHQGVLPTVAADAARAAIEQKQRPYQLSDDLFGDVPRRLKAAIGTLVGVPGAEVILGNSTSYGLHLLAQGLPLHSGEEVLFVEGEFPATVLPWTAARGQGVQLRFVRPSGPRLSAADLDREIGPSTRVVCLSWVFSITGVAVDLGELGAVCRDRGVTFVVNASQALGARPLDLSSVPVDALVSCGHKWLCGPYGTGLCWIRPDLLETLQYAQPYWLHAQRAADLGRGLVYEAPTGLGASRYDVFATANFFNYRAWTAALEYFLAHDPAKIAEYDAGLVERLVAGVDRAGYQLLSPAGGDARSTLVLLTHRDKDRNPQIHQALRAAGIFIALRDGNLRVSPHLHNTDADIERVLGALVDAAED
jgi:selenocysteine lyase/cysteine desulfurase